MSEYAPPVDEFPPDDAYAEPVPRVDPATLIEQQVIGTALRYPRSVTELQREASGGDFHDLRLGRVFTGIADMVTAGEPVDPLAIWDKLAEWDVRGIDVTDLYAWHDAALTPEHGAAHARSVRSASMRRLIAAVGDDLRALSDDPAATIAKAQQQLTLIRDLAPGGKKPVIWLRDLMDVPDEEDAYDWLIPDLLERGDRLMLSAAEGSGKALALDTPIPTPTGWTTMGDLAAGDVVLGADGIATRVLAATDVMRGRPCFRVEFSDGSVIVADAEHQWVTADYAARASAARKRARDVLPRGTDQSWRAALPAVRTTAEIADTLRARDGFCLNHSIDATSALDLSEVDLPVDPYTLGAWLGDGTTRSGALTLNYLDAEHIESRIPYPHHRIASHNLSGSVGTRIEGGNALLRSAGVLGEKHIPTAYLRASKVQRWGLLRGLMDTDGYIADARGAGRGKGAAGCELTLMNPRLAADALELILSLGIIATMRESDAVLEGRVVGRRQRIVFQSHENPFTLPRKADRWFPPRTQRSRRRFITAVVPVDSVPVRCIQVDNADHMYLAGRSMIPTHNSVFLRQIAICAAAGIHPFRFHQIDPIRVLFIDAENSERQWRRSSRPLIQHAVERGRRDPRGHMAVHCVPVMDLTKPDDIGRIHGWMDEVKPDLLVLGPLYRMTHGSLNNDDDVAPVLHALDTLRDRGVAMLIEVHAGHARSTSGERELRPRGSSALLGWPEFGLGLRKNKTLEGRHPTYSLVRWRGDRDRREWPNPLTRGQIWPWEPSATLEGGWR